jgi:hypothetical protein
MFKKIIIFIIIFLNTNVFALNLKPLSEELHKLDITADATRIYIYSRCSGLYGALWDSLLSNNENELAKKMLINQKDLGLRALVIDMRLNDRNTYESAVEQKIIIQNFKDKYITMINKNLKENGKYFQGIWVEGDVQICGPIVASIQALQ